jgi:DNA-binding response OmpR family regulator
MANRDRILVVEDDPDTLALLFSALTRDGYSVLTADDGQQAMDLLIRGIRPRLMIVDLMMPKVSGTDLLAHVRTDPDLRTMATIVITGMPRDQVKVVADAVFTKPIDLQALMLRVRALHRSANPPLV